MERRPTTRRWARRWLLVGIGTVAIAVGAGGAQAAEGELASPGVSAVAPPAETRYVAQLRRAATQVEAATAEVLSVDEADSAALQAVGQHLSAAAGAACRTLRAYQRADTRFGTDEEYQLVQKLSRQLGQARARFGSIGGVTLTGPTVEQRSAAERLVRRLATGAASDAIADWIGDQQLAGIVTSGGLEQMKNGLRRELTRRIDAEARRLSQRATGMSLSLGTPLKTQVESQIDQAALRWLAKTVLRWDATGLVIQVVGVPIVRFLRSELKAAFRDHKHVTERTNRTVTGFEARGAELQKLVDSADSSSLDRVRRLLLRARRALDATLYLRSDLKKQGRTDLIARLAAAEAALKAKMGETRAAFLLDSALARSNLVQLADNACRQQGEIVKMTKTIGTCTDRLGLEWREYEVGYTGTWKRATCATSTWTASWKGGCDRSSVTIVRSGTTVTAKRTDRCTFSPDFTATYRGTIAGRTITGTEECRCRKAFPCSGSPRTWTQTWNAVIVR